MKRRWTNIIKRAVEYVRKDAEIAFELESGERAQYVIKSNCLTTEEAEQIAIEFCVKLNNDIESLIKSRVAGLKKAKE